MRNKKVSHFMSPPKLLYNPKKYNIYNLRGGEIHEIQG
jgi:hypothetical protein